MWVFLSSLPSGNLLISGSCVVKTIVLVFPNATCDFRFLLYSVFGCAFLCAGEPKSSLLHGS